MNAMGGNSRRRSGGVGGAVIAQSGHSLDFVFALLGLLVSVLSLCFTSQGGSKWLDLYRIFHVLFAVAWYYCSWILVGILKQIINDVNCGVHPNSVSGHYNFFTFSILSVLALKLKFDKEQHAACAFKWTRDLFFIIPYMVFVLLSVFILRDTYVLGYHSMRQILYGATLGLVSHTLFMYTVSDIRRPHHARKEDANHGDLRRPCIALFLVWVSFSASYVSHTAMVSDTEIKFGRLIRQCIPGLVACIMCLFIANHLQQKAATPSSRIVNNEERT